MIRIGMSKAGDSWSSPPWIWHLVGNCFDPCPLNDNPSFDGLELDWVKESMNVGLRVYVNPPYSNVMPWVIKAIEENKRGCKVIMLLKHDSSTRWYAKLKEANAHMLMPMQRLKFGGKSGGCAFPSLLVVLD